MPSFDVVSEIDKPELNNAIHQANKELSTRFDFKGSDARVEQSDTRLTVYADNEFQIKQAVDVLLTKLSKRGLDLGCLSHQPIEEIGGGKTIEVPKMDWEIIKYKQSKTDPNDIEPETVGTFTQYPLKLAWAVTAHMARCGHLPSKRRH